MVPRRGDVRPGHGELMRRIAAGDAAALSDLYDLSSRYVYGICLKVLRNHADAEEVALDVYTQAWRQAARFDAGRGEPLTWLLMLARSRAIDRLRARGGVRRHEEDLDQVRDVASTLLDPESGSALAERASAVRAALARLPVEQREVIELAYFQGLTHTEIAEKLAQPLGTAKSRIRLALARLRQTLGSGDEGWTT
ncbi:MAG: sigma-70 family RNA polymerase sigma factor [Thermoanaerobaculia bacterium]